MAASMIGVELGVIGQATGAALIGAGLLSVVVFPLLAAPLLDAGAAGQDGSPTTAAHATMAP